MKKLFSFIGLLFSLALASCEAPNKYSQYYTARPALPKLKRVALSQVSLEEFSSQGKMKQRIDHLRSNGYELIGYSLFDSEYTPPLFAKRFGAQLGCERVITIREKIGQGVGTRMDTATYSPPTMGFVNTTLYSPSGRPYSAVSTVFNPAQQTFIARDYVYDTYRHGAAFFAKRETLTQAQQ